MIASVAEAEPRAPEPAPAGSPPLTWSAIDHDSERRCELAYRRKPSLKQTLLRWLIEYNRY